MPMPESWREAYLCHARSESYRVALAQAEQRCAELAAGGFYVAYSGGKDSLVALDLCAQFKPPVVFYDFGTPEAKQSNVIPQWLREEVQQTISGHYGLELVVVTKHRNFLCGMEYAWPGTRVVTIPDPVFWLEGVREVAQGFGWRTAVVGLRRQESVRRKHRIDANRWVSEEQQEVWPVADWTERDIWAHIVSRDLPYSTYYDRCAQVTGTYEGLRMTSLFSDGLKGIGDDLHGVAFWADRPRGT
jgi:phosphoadenosine phosphosulfate reductase